MQRQVRANPVTPGPQEHAHAGVPDHDAAGLAGVARGDREALGALYDRHAPVLLALALRLTGERAAADEVVHDAFLALWHEARNVDGARTSVGTWLVARVRGLALGRRRAAPAASAARLRPEALGLAPELALVLELTYFDGLTVTEAAQRLGVPEALCRDRLARAFAALGERQIAVEEGTS